MCLSVQDNLDDALEQAGSFDRVNSLGDGTIQLIQGFVDVLAHRERLTLLIFKTSRHNLAHSKTLRYLLRPATWQLEARKAIGIRPDLVDPKQAHHPTNDSSRRLWDTQQLQP